MKSPAGSEKCSLVSGAPFPVNPYEGAGQVDQNQWWPFSVKNELDITAGADAILYFVVENTTANPTPTGLHCRVFFDFDLQLKRAQRLVVTETEPESANPDRMHLKSVFHRNGTLPPAPTVPVLRRNFVRTGNRAPRPVTCDSEAFMWHSSFLRTVPGCIARLIDGGM